MTFSVIVPCLNGMPFLKETLESIQSNLQTVQGETIFQDAGSTDGSLEWAQTILPPSSIRSEKDLGQYDAINRGFHHAQGDVLCWINADDTLKPGSLQKVQEIFENNPTIQWIVGGFEMIDSQGKEIRKIHQSYKHWLLKNYRNELLFFENPIPQMSVFIRKNIFLKAGDLSSYYLAFDYEYWLRLSSLHTPWITLDILSQFRWHPDSKSSQNHRQLFDEQYEIACRYTKNPFFRFLHRMTRERNRLFYTWLP
ncbi:MAG: glycosyltransferase family 2 protein [Verrucomicrobiota bacterium]